MPPRDTIDPVVLTPLRIRQATCCTDNKSPPKPYWSNWYLLLKNEMVTIYTMFTTMSDSLHERHTFHVVALTYAHSPQLIVYNSLFSNKFRTKAVHGSILNFTYKPLTQSIPYDGTEWIGSKFRLEFLSRVFLAMYPHEWRSEAWASQACVWQIIWHEISLMLDTDVIWCTLP